MLKDVINTLHQTFKVEVDILDIELTGLDLREIRDVINQPESVVNPQALNSRDIFPLLGLQRRFPEGDGSFQ